METCPAAMTNPGPRYKAGLCSGIQSRSLERTISSELQEANAYTRPIEWILS